MDERAARHPAGEAERGETAPGPQGGDPVCWLHRVCPECGAFSDTAPPTVCHRCGTRFGD